MTTERVLRPLFFCFNLDEGPGTESCKTCSCFLLVLVNPLESAIAPSIFFGSPGRTLRSIFFLVFWGEKPGVFFSLFLSLSAFCHPSPILYFSPSSRYLPCIPIGSKPTLFFTNWPRHRTKGDGRVCRKEQAAQRINFNTWQRVRTPFILYVHRVGVSLRLIL